MRLVTCSGASCEVEACAEVSGVTSSSCSEDKALALVCSVRILLSGTTGRGV